MTDTLKPVPSKEFRISSKHLFLTYPDKEKLKVLTIQQIINLWKAKTKSLKAVLTYIIVARETGQEQHDSKDYEHIHILASFDRKIEIKNCRWTDMLEVHGHYTAVNRRHGSVEQIRKYCMKDGNYLEWKDTSAITRLSDPGTSLTRLIEHLQAIDVPGDRLKAINGLSGAAKAIYSLHFDRIQRALTVNIQNHYHQPRYQRCQFNEPAPVTNWVKEERQIKALVLIGTSGTGKTELAKALFDNPLVVSVLDELRELNASHDGLILDDVQLSRLQHQQLIHLLDLETARGVNVKYGTAKLQAGLARVVTSNQSLNKLLGLTPDQQIPTELARRMRVVVVSEDLRKDPQNRS